jgi:hypothetical protein
VVGDARPVNEQEHSVHQLSSSTSLTSSNLLHPKFWHPVHRNRNRITVTHFIRFASSKGLVSPSWSFACAWISQRRLSVPRCCCVLVQVNTAVCFC